MRKSPNGDLWPPLPPNTPATQNFLFQQYFQIYSTKIGGENKTTFERLKFQDCFLLDTFPYFLILKKKTCVGRDEYHITCKGQRTTSGVSTFYLVGTLSSLRKPAFLSNNQGLFISISYPAI